MFELPYPVTALLTEYRDYVIPLSMLCLIRWVVGRAAARSAVTFVISAIIVFAAYLALCRILRIDRETESLTYVTDRFGPIYLAAAAAVGALASLFRPRADTSRFLASVLASAPDDRVRNGIEAVNMGERAAQLSGRRRPQILNTLAAAYAEAGRFDDALTTGREALQLAGDSGETNLASLIQSRLTLYETHKPFRQPPPQ